MKILIADDHQLYLEALAILVNRLDPQAEVTRASSYPEILTLAKTRVDWDGMLVDLNMPGMSYYDGISQLSAAYPDLPIIVITSSDNPVDVSQALSAGALGLISKSMDSDEMLAALRLMLHSGVSIHPSTQVTDQPTNPADAVLLEALTPRQLEVLQQLCQGISNKQIARDMDLSESTVKLHVRAILRALKVDNRTQAVLVAQDLI